MSCVGTVHNVVPRPLLQLFLSPGCSDIAVQLWGRVGGKARGDTFVFLFFYLPKRGQSGQLAPVMQ